MKMNRIILSIFLASVSIAMMTSAIPMMPAAGSYEIIPGVTIEDLDTCNDYYVNQPFEEFMKLDAETFLSLPDVPDTVKRQYQDLCYADREDAPRLYFQLNDKVAFDGTQLEPYSPAGDPAKSELCRILQIPDEAFYFIDYDTTFPQYPYRLFFDETASGDTARKLTFYLMHHPAISGSMVQWACYGGAIGDPDTSDTSELIRDGIITIGDIEYQKYDNRFEIVRISPDAVTAVIPQEIEGLPVYWSTSVPTSPITNCPNLTAFEVTDAAVETGAHFTVRDGVLYQDHELIAYPPAKPDVSYEIPEDTVRIENHAFESALFLETVTLPDSLQWIGYRSFYRCKVLREIIGNAPLASPHSVSECESLETITVSGNVGRISFAGFPKLKKLTFAEDTVIYGNIIIADNPLLTELHLPPAKPDNQDIALLISGCESLETVTLYNGCLQGSITASNTDVIEDCPALKTIVVRSQYPSSQQPLLLKHLSQLETVTYLETQTATYNGVDDNGHAVEYPALLCNETKNFTVYGEKTNTFLKTFCQDKNIPFAENGSARLGDVNGDDVLDILDVILLNKNLMIGTPLSKIGRVAADFNQDGNVDEADALEMLKHIVGLA